MTHPALTMSTMRADAWKQQANDEDFYRYLYELSLIYAKRKHKQGSGPLNETALFVDFKHWRDEMMDDIIKMSSVARG